MKSTKSENIFGWFYWIFFVLYFAMYFILAMGVYGWILGGISTEKFAIFFFYFCVPFGLPVYMLLLIYIHVALRDILTDFKRGKWHLPLLINTVIFSVCIFLVLTDNMVFKIVFIANGFLLFVQLGCNFYIMVKGIKQTFFNKNDKNGEYASS